MSLSFARGEEVDKVNIDWSSKKWMKKYKMVLGTDENLESLIDECIEAGKYGLDIETTGLDARVFDTEAGFGRTKDVIVGICLAPAEKKKGFYIPLRHRPKNVESFSCNVSYSLFEEQFRRLSSSSAVAVFHNSKFDQEFLEFPGHEPLGDYDDHTRWEDTYLLAYLRNPKQKSLRLKKLSKEELGKEMISLKELFPPGTKVLNFSLLNPLSEGVLEYACSDAICTVELEPKLRKEGLYLKGKGANKKPHNQEVIYAIEKMCITATRWMERNRLHINLKTVKELIQLGQQECVRSLDEMYEKVSKVLERDITPLYHYLLKQKIKDRNPYLEASDDLERKLKYMIEESRKEAEKILKGAKKNDRAINEKLRQNPELSDLVNRVSPGKKEGVELLEEYDIMSNQKLGILLYDLGIPKLKKTESGQIATDKATLEKLLQDKSLKNKFPFLELVQWFRENQNALGKLEALYEDTNIKDNTLWVKFKNAGTDTGRFATPGDKKHKTSGGTKFNIQSIPATYDKERPPSLLRIRECFHARDGFFLVAIDFSGVELRIVSNLSGEPKWIDAFFSCSNCNHQFDRGDGKTTPPAPPKFCPICGSDKIGDIHTMTALAIYGERARVLENWKQLRANGKSTNFALCYGGSGKAVVRSTGCSENEGNRVKRQFDSTYTVLRDWWKKIRQVAKKDKYVRTALGRQYPLPDIDHEDGYWRSKAERNAVNAPVQGCIAPESRIPTSKGLLKVKDLFQTGKPFKVWTGKSWEQAKALYSGPKVLCKTKLSSGKQILTSPDHRFLIYGKRQNNSNVYTWIEQKNLEKDMWVAVDGASIDFPDSSKKLSVNENNEFLWEFLGLLYRGGSLYSEGFDLLVEEPNLESLQKEYIKELVKKCRETLENDQQQGRIQNNTLFSFCRDILEIKDKESFTKKFPEMIWKESSKNRRAFLHGYFSIEGEVSITENTKTTTESLKEIPALLGSLGIRSLFEEETGKLVIIDEDLFIEKIRTKIPYEQGNLLGRASEGDLPPDLVSWVGEVISCSSVYSELTPGEKATVLRLVTGVGSKSLCLGYLLKVPGKEIPAALVDSLNYDWEKIVNRQETEEFVEMYDIEVFDEFHAFVCDGVIVHNSSADITKLAMAKIYFLCKKRNWLGKIKMIATMHDELVFEISKDIIEEALPILAETMARNKVILNRRWPVPLTLDIEIGNDWSVPWDLYAIQHKVELRRQLERPNLSEGEMNGILRKLLEVVPKEKIFEKGFESIDWPEELKPYFKEAKIITTPEGKESLQRAYKHLFKDAEDIKTRPVIEKSEKEDYEVLLFQLPQVLTTELALKLGTVIKNSRTDTGVHLVIQNHQGKEVTPREIFLDIDAFNKELKKEGLKN